MTYERRAYDDVSPATEMRADCRAVAAVLDRSRRSAAERTARAALRPAPSLRYDDYPREVAKPVIEVGEAATRLAAALDG